MDSKNERDAKMELVSATEEKSSRVACMIDNYI